MSDKLDCEMYGISRIDDDQNYTHAWRVSIRRRGKMFVKNFPDLQLGGSDESLRQAKSHRNYIVLTYPPVTRKEFCDANRRNNKTGIPGVYRYAKPYKLKDGTIKKIWYWEANWPDAKGQSVSQSFRVSVYGEKGAKERAVAVRKEGMNTVDGTFWKARVSDVLVEKLLKMENT